MTFNLNLDWAHIKEETIFNEHGAGQSKIHRDWTLLPLDATALVLQVLEEGRRKYGRDSWRTISEHDHRQHMIEHAMASYQCSDDTLLEMEHLSHVVCRALFALDILYQEIKNTDLMELSFIDKETK